VCTAADRREELRPDGPPVYRGTNYNLSLKTSKLDFNFDTEMDSFHLSFQTSGNDLDFAFAQLSK